MARVVAVTSVFLLFVHVTMSITVQELFPDVKANLTKVKWAHKTNSQAALRAVMNSTEIQMIEADVVLGRRTTEPATVTPYPIMAHPPDNTSDLTLQEFIDTVLLNKTKGIKLDFKSIEAFEQGVLLLQNNSNLSQLPVWLNADILPGPVNASSNGTVDAKRFLDGAAKLPGMLLSIGWTTKLPQPLQNATTANYTIDQLKEMTKLVGELKGNQSVTYPVRACFVANDVEGLAQLLNKTVARNATLTVWSSEGDAVNATLLSRVIKRIGLDKVYLDVPASLSSQLDLSNSALTAKASLPVMLGTLILAAFRAKLL